MKAWLKKRFKNEEGFTLVELLAVIVILGIIAAIAVPSIGSIIDNSRKDAHLANAQTLLESARLYEVSDDSADTSGAITLKTLQDGDFVSDSINPPGDATYDSTKTTVDLSTGKVVLASSTLTYFDYDPNASDARDEVSLEGVKASGSPE